MKGFVIRRTVGKEVTYARPEVSNSGWDTDIQEAMIFPERTIPLSLIEFRELIKAPGVCEVVEVNASVTIV